MSCRTLASSKNSASFIGESSARNHEFDFVMAALSWEAHKNVWIIPNLKFAVYSENDLLKDAPDYEKPGNDVYTNLTLWFKFKRMAIPLYSFSNTIRPSTIVIWTCMFRTSLGSFSTILRSMTTMSASLPAFKDPRTASSRMQA